MCQDTIFSKKYVHHFVNNFYLDIIKTKACNYQATESKNKPVYCDDKHWLTAVKGEMSLSNDVQKTVTIGN